MPNSLELRHQRANLWEQMKALNERAEAEGRDLSAEESEQWDRMTAEARSLDARIERQETLERAPASDEPRDLPVERPGRAGEGEAEERAAQQREAFRSYLRFGLAEMPAEQRAIWSAARTVLPVEGRALGIGADPSGGYLVPDDFRRSIEVAMKDFGGMREAANVLSTESGVDLILPTTDDTSNTGAILGEHQAVSQQDVTIGQKVLRAYMYTSKEVLVSWQLLQDSAIDVEALLRGLLAERIGRATNAHFTTGNGADKPTGITVDAAAGVTAAAVNAVTTDELVNLEYTVDRAYRPNARWMFHSNTLRDLRKLKDGDGRYIWQPGMTSGNPNTLFGYGYVVNDDMPQMLTGNVAILFGMLSKYVIRDVRGFFLRRLDERHAENGQVAFLGFSRHDGKLIDAGQGPVRALTMA